MLRFTGRINRARFFRMMLLSQISVWLAGGAISFLVFLSVRWLPAPIGGALVSGSVLLTLLASYLVLAGPISRRAQDLGWSPKIVLSLFAITALCVVVGLASMLLPVGLADWTLGSLRFVAAPGQLVFLLLLILPGQKVENVYGAEPNPGWS